MVETAAQQGEGVIGFVAAFPWPPSRYFSVSASWDAFAISIGCGWPGEISRQKRITPLISKPIASTKTEPNIHASRLWGNIW